MDEDRLAELLSQLQQLSVQGQSVDLHNLCQDCPELIPELERRFEAVRHIQQLAREGNTPSAPTPSHPNAPAGSPPVVGSSNLTGAFFSAVTGGHDPSQTAEPPLLLGRYRVEKFLGRGGFGMVVQAFDQLLLRPVAIKTHRIDRLRLKGRYLDLLTEARKLAAIDHPNVVRIHDVAEGGDQIFIISALIDGPDLARQLLDRRLTIPEAVSLVIDIALALHHIHLSGLVHRDVKPANILLDSRHRPFLSDFGLAASEEDLQTEQAGVLGTRAYMSPEQIRGDSHLVDGRADIYSLGVVLYELLTGRVPFKGSSSFEYREQILNRPPRPPRAIDDSIPPELERICLKCLAKSVEDRYTTALDLANELRVWRDRAPTPPSSPTPLPRPSSVYLLVGGALLGVLLLLQITSWIRPARTDPPPSVPRPADRGPGSPQRGQWVDLLEELPRIVFHPERFAHQFDVRKRELWWDTRGDCLIRLGTTRSDDYELEATFEQSRILGLRGLVLGLPALDGELPSSTRCTALLVGYDPQQRKSGILFLGRLTLNPAAGEVRDLERLSPDLLLTASPTRFVLSVRVKQGQLAWVRVDHEEQQGFVEHRARVGPRLTGDFGILADSGSTRLLKARYKLYSSEN